MKIFTSLSNEPEHMRKVYAQAVVVFYICYDVQIQKGMYSVLF